MCKCLDCLAEILQARGANPEQVQFRPYYQAFDMFNGINVQHGIFKNEAGVLYSGRLVVLSGATDLNLVCLDDVNHTATVSASPVATSMGVDLAQGGLEEVIMKYIAPSSDCTGYFIGHEIRVNGIS